MPPLNIQADKATSEYKSIQFTTAVLAVADSEHILVNMFLGQPVVKSHGVEGLSTAILENLTDNFYEYEQVDMATGDGVYPKWSVFDKLKSSIGLGDTFKLDGLGPVDNRPSTD